MNRLHRLTFLWLLCSLVHAAQAQPLLISADRVFDGQQLLTDSAVLIVNDRIQAIGPASDFASVAAQRLALGDATVLPGLIELHAHLRFQQVPADTVLQHGITTLRDLGGPLSPASGGEGQLRLLSAGPILTAANGYPIATLGEDSGIAIAINTAEQARETVRGLIADGAVIIKIALEPGGEPGAPWSAHGNHRHGSPSHQAWPMLSQALVNAIVDEAHRAQRRVSAHVAEKRGVQIALNAGVDEWAHTPCQTLPEAQLQQAARQHVHIISTVDTLSHCPGVAHNLQRLAALGAPILYGAEIAHPDIPWGIDANELQHIGRLTGLDTWGVLALATAQSGAYLGIEGLGRLQAGAPADVIAVKGNIQHRLKRLEYPDLVLSGGRLVLNRF